MTTNDQAEALAALDALTTPTKHSASVREIANYLSWPIRSTFRALSGNPLLQVWTFCDIQPLTNEEMGNAWFGRVRASAYGVS
jgi:hypothetical protein